MKPNKGKAVAKILISARIWEYAKQNFFHGH
jgi:hypothetical protein